MAVSAKMDLQVMGEQFAKMMMNATMQPSSVESWQTAQTLLGVISVHAHQVTHQLGGKTFYLMMVPNVVISMNAQRPVPVEALQSATTQKDHLTALVKKATYHPQGSYSFTLKTVLCVQKTPRKTVI